MYLFQSDVETGGSTTCFPGNGAEPSDIDWALCTKGLSDAGMIKAGVYHAKVGVSAHCPIFITIKAQKWLSLVDSDMATYKRHKYGQNHIKGGDSDKRITTYKKFIQSKSVYIL